MGRRGRRGNKREREREEYETGRGRHTGDTHGRRVALQLAIEYTKGLEGRSSILGELETSLLTQYKSLNTRGLEKIKRSSAVWTGYGMHTTTTRWS